MKLICTLLLSFVLFIHPVSAQGRVGQVFAVPELGTDLEGLKKAGNLKLNAPLTADFLKQATANIERDLYNKGYLYAHIDSVQLKSRPEAGNVDLYFFGRRGPQIKIAEVKILSTALPAEVYLRNFPQLENRPWSRPLIHEAAQLCLKTAAARGYAFAEVQPLAPTITGGRQQANLTIQINEGKPVYIRRLEVSGNTYTKTHVILRELPPLQDRLYSEQAVNQIAERLQRLGIFSKINSPQLFRIAPDSLALRISVKEGNATTFDGVVGYIPKSGTADGYFTGLVDISFNNLFGSGRRFAVHWKKPDNLSEEFLLQYNEPWVFDYPFDLGGTLQRTVRDTSFIHWNYGLDARLRLFDNWALLGQLQQDMYVPDSVASRTRRLAKSRVVNLQAGIEFDSRDYPTNPRRGIFYKSAYTLGLKENLGPKYLLQEDSLRKSENLHTVRIQLEFYQPLWTNQVLAVLLNGAQVRGNRLQLTDYFWFGGGRSLRGYRENQFFGSRVGWINVEYRFLLGRNSRLALFNDWGYYAQNISSTKKEHFLPGYGLGVRFDTPLGVMGVDFALGRGDNFRQAKIHFGLVNRF